MAMLRRVFIVLLELLSLAGLVAAAVAGYKHELFGAMLFAVAVMFGLAALFVHKRETGELLVAYFLLAVFVIPLIVVSGGNVTGGSSDFDPFEFFRSASYRSRAYSDWKAASISQKFREAMAVLWNLALLLAIIAFWMAVVYTAIHLVRYRRLPPWA